MKKLKAIIALWLLLMVIPLAGAFLLKKDRELEKNVLLNLMVQSDLDAEMESLKAQAILIRTNLTVDPEKSVVNKKKLNHFFTKDPTGIYTKKFLEAVNQTKGMIVRINKSVMELPYHKISCGTTRSAKEIEGDSGACLASVSCEEDVLEQGYFHLFYFTKEQIGGRVTVTSRYDSGYVKQARIEGKKTITLGGEAFRKRYGLPSSCFFVENGKKEVRITTKGIGHGFGLSQSMADSLAKEGKDAKEILKYFFRNVEFYQNE